MLILLIVFGVTFLVAGFLGADGVVSELDDEERGRWQGISLTSLFIFAFLLADIIRFHLRIEWV